MPRRPLLSASASSARSRSSSRSASRQEKAEQGRNAKSRPLRLHSEAARCSLRGGASTSRLRQPSRTQPHAAEPLPLPPASIQDSACFSPPFLRGRRRLPKAKTQKRSLLRGAAGLLLDSAAPRHLGPELRAELSVARADGRCSYRLATPGAPGAGPWPTTPRGGKAVPQLVRQSWKVSCLTRGVLGEAAEPQRPPGGPGLKINPAAPSCAVSSCQPCWEDCVRGTFNQRRGCTSRVPVTVSILGFGLELPSFFVSSQAGTFNPKSTKDPPLFCRASVRRHLIVQVSWNPCSVRATAVLMTGCEFKLQCS